MSNIHKNFNSRTRVGATKKQLGGRIGLLVSIHAPVWVRHLEFKLFDASRVFQFTHPCGCDFLIRQFSKCVQEFQFTHPCGCDVLLTARSTLRMKFQFTHPCGCDQSPERAVARTRGFNSRTRVGATYFPVCPVDDQPVSIHAPVWVRLFALCLDMISMMFQFTHPCGCDFRP